MKRTAEIPNLGITVKINFDVQTSFLKLKKNDIESRTYGRGALPTPMVDTYAMLFDKDTPTRYVFLTTLIGPVTKNKCDVYYDSVDEFIFVIPNLDNICVGRNDFIMIDGVVIGTRAFNNSSSAIVASMTDTLDNTHKVKLNNPTKLESSITMLSYPGISSGNTRNNNGVEVMINDALNVTSKRMTPVYFVSLEDIKKLLPDGKAIHSSVVPLSMEEYMFKHNNLTTIGDDEVLGFVFEL